MKFETENLKLGGEGENKMTYQQSDQSTINNQQSTILGLRARALAEEAKSAEEDEARLEVVEFLLAHERYALELFHIKEVYPLKELTPLPGLPRFVLGITNVRGRILSIIDLKIFFELPEQGLSNLNRVIVLHSGEMEFGIFADQIIGVCSIPVKDVQASLPTLTGIREKYLKGITPDSVVILDGKKILMDDNIIIHGEA